MVSHGFESKGADVRISTEPQNNENVNKQNNEDEINNEDAIIAKAAINDEEDNSEEAINVDTQKND